MLLATIVALPLFLALTSAGEDRRPNPDGGSCGEADLYDRKGERGLLFSDNVCRQVTGIFEASTVFKGCDCTMYNGYACTNDGFEARADATEAEVQVTYTRDMRLNWYMCLRRK